jgi:purine-binding chemotaxis protein CheW
MEGRIVVDTVLAVNHASEERAAAMLVKKYLTFVLQGEEYGVEILKVREIISIMNITPVPRVPDYIKGVINLRGKVYLL